MEQRASRDLAHKAIFVLAFFCAGVGVLIFGADMELGPLTVALCVLFAIYVVITRVLSRTGFSLLDPGIFFAFVVLVYTAIPLGSFAVFGLTLSSFADNRLLSIDLQTNSVREVALIAIAAFVGFGTMYLALRRFEGVAERPRHAIEPIPLQVVFALSSAILILIGALIAARGRGYADLYVFYRELPVALIQFLNINSQLFVLSVFALVYSLLTQRRLIACAAVVMIALTVSGLASSARTNLFLLVLGGAVIYDRVYGRIRLRAILPAVVVGLFLFLTLGIFRIGTTVNTSEVLRNVNFVEKFSTGSEFMAVFATGLDIQNLKHEGLVVSAIPQIYFTDLVRLIPQQVLPFDKFDPSSWYVGTFYPDAAQRGGAYAFGLTAEAILGGGVPDALIRGLLLGMLIALLFNYLSKGTRSLWKEVMAAWLFVNLYQCFRDTTFTILARGLYQFLPALLVMLGAVAMIRAAGRNIAAGHAVKPSLPPNETTVPVVQ